MSSSFDHIQDLIYKIRGQQVMLDSDLSKLYGVETSALNRQVKRNITRFPEDFMFQLTLDEHQILKCHIGISSAQHGGRRTQTFVFTELGIAKVFKVVFQRLDQLEGQKKSESKEKKKKIGLKN